MIYPPSFYRNILLTFLFCALFGLFFNLGYAQNNPVNTYQTLIDRLKSSDTSINFTELRMLFTQLPNYNPYKTMQELQEKENQMWQEYKNSNYNKALEIGNSILEINYLRIMTHYIFSEVYGKLGDTQKQKFHEDVFFGLIDSIIQSGDGKNPETAMTVIAVREEYDVLDVLGFEQESQTLIEKDGKRFDLMVTKNSETGETRDFYFNIDLFYDKAQEIIEESDISSKTTPQIEPTISEISTSPTPTTTEPSIPTSMIPIPEPSLLPLATPTPQVTGLPQPTSFATSIPTMMPQPPSAVIPQTLIVNPPPGWIPQPTEDPTQIGYYQLTNQQNIVVAEYIAVLETLSSPLDLRGYLSYLQGSRLKPPLFNSYVPQQTIDISLAGLPALRHDFLFTTDNIQLKAMAIFVVLGNKAYTFLFYSTVNDFPNLETTFLQALSTIATPGISVPQPSPFIPSPTVDTYTSPTPQQPAAGNWYQDPGGLFSVPLPADSAKKQDVQNGVVYTSPNNGEIYIMNFPTETEAQSTVSSLAGGKSFRAETTLNAGNRQAQVKIYSFTQNNMNYALLISSYPGTPVLVIIVIPADQYNASQAWMISTITGIQFR